MPRLLIESKPVAQITQWGHLYLVYQNDAGDELVLRGGSSLSLSKGNIVVETGVPINDSHDKRVDINGNPLTPADRGSRELDLNGRAVEDVWTLMLQQTQNIADAKLAFKPEQNSNSLINSVLNSVGIDVLTTMPYAAHGDYLGIENRLKLNPRLIGGDNDDIMRGWTGLDLLAGGAGDDWLSGWAGNDILKGGDGNDTLDGGSGQDQTLGGKGNDNYRVDQSGDRAIETADNGIDTVISGVSFTLGGNLENLALSGLNNIKAIGNKLDNTLMGNVGNNLLVGGDGNDILGGGLGKDRLTAGKGFDRFVFDTQPSKSNIDALTDFSQGEDKIVLSSIIFGTYKSAEDFTSIAKLAVGLLAGKHLLYEVSSGSLYHDADGSGIGNPPELLVKLIGKVNLDANDFIVA